MANKTKHEQNLIEKVFAGLLLVVFGGIVLHAPLSVGFGTLLPDYALLIKSWKEILLLIATVLAVVIVTRRQLWRELGRDWLFRLIVAYAALHILLVGVFFQGVQPTLAGLAIDLRYILFFGLVYVLVKTLPGYRRLLLRIGAIGAAIVVGFATLQLFLPADVLSHIGYDKDTTIAPYLTVDQNHNYIRVNSTLRGPNPLGVYAVVVLVLLVSAVVYAKLNLRHRKVFILTGVLAACSLIALWISYSRSALLAAAATLAVVLIITVGSKLSRRVWVSLAVVGLILVGGLYVARETDFVSNVILHEDPGESNNVNSNDGHWSSLVHGTERLLVQPLGAGIGSTGSASLFGDKNVVIENQYLFTAHEAGWLGLILFVAIFVIIMLRLWRGRRDWLSIGMFASGIGLALIGLIQPVWVDDTVSIIWWGLAAIALAGGIYVRKSTK